MDTQLFQLSPGAHHLTNVLFHSVAGVLLFLFLQRSTGRLGCSALVAALFCIHPTHVESVAWIAERKDTLIALFWMATLNAYLSYSRKRTFGRYLLALLCFILDLMSKPEAVTLPFALLLVDYWPLGRFGNPTHATNLRSAKPETATKQESSGTFRSRVVLSLVIEKIPFFLLAGAASVAALQAQRDLGAVTSLAVMDRSLRVDNALIAYGTYVLKTFWPTHLAVIYARVGAWPFGQVLVAGSFWAAVTCLAARWRHSHSYFIVGWLWFLGVLVPMIGIVQVGAQWMADRYTYISTIGLFIIIAWGGADLLRRFSLPRLVGLAFALPVLGVLALVTHRQLLYWQNSETLFAHAAAVTRGNWLAEHNLALALGNEGRYAEADVHLAKALQISPRNPTVNKTRGDTWLDRGIPERAAECYREVIAVKPDDLEVRESLAWIYATSEDADLRSGFLAVELTEKVCQESKTANARQYDVLAAAYAENKQFAKAEAAARKACALAEVAGENPAEIRKRLELYQTDQPYRSRFAPRRPGQLAGRRP